MRGESLLRLERRLVILAVTSVDAGEDVAPMRVAPLDIHAVVTYLCGVIGAMIHPMKPSEMFGQAIELALLVVLTIGVLMFGYALAVWLLTIVGG